MRNKLAQPYPEHLSQLVNGPEPLQIRGVTSEIKHFFSVAIRFANDKICAWFSPAGFALKLLETKRQSLIHNCNGEEFRFFSNRPIKREYVALSEFIIQDKNALHELVDEIVRYAVCFPSNSRDR